MKGLSVLILVGFCILAYGLPQEKYTTKYDNIDLEAILRSDRLMRNYIDCVLGKRACTKDGAELKKHLPDAINNGCAKCSQVQKNGSRKIIRHLIKNKRPWWNELEQRFDPQGTYRARYADELRQEGITL